LSYNFSMERPKARLEGSLWNKGKVGLLFGGILLAALLIWVPAIRWFLAISVVIGVAMAAVIHLWNEHRPIKTEPKDQIRLHLMDDDK
jgi:Na+-translocating ferredoxin:NAD+ oxidoreductase RnfD subunit